MSDVTPDIRNHDFKSHCMEFSTSNSFPLIIYFDNKAFKAHLSAATLHLKDDFSYFSSTSRFSSTNASNFSSFLRLDSTIKDASMILDKEIEIFHFNS